MESVVIKIFDTQNDHVVLERFTQQGSPVLSWNGSDDNFQTIMSSELNFNMLSENAEDGRYLDLFTGDESRYLVKVEKVLASDNFPEVQNNNLLWQGFLLPDQYNEPYKNVNFFVDFTATDGLGLLKDKYFSFFPYDYNETVIKIIAQCLKRTNLYQDIHISEAFRLETIGWRDVFLNSKNFRGEFKQGVGSIEASLSDATDYNSCYDVLETVLNALGSTLFSYRGNWYVVGFNKKHVVLDTFKVYDFHGNFKANLGYVKTVHENVFFEGIPIVYNNSPLAYVDVSSDLDFDEVVYKDLGLVDVDDSGAIEYDARDLWISGSAFEIGRGDGRGEFLAANVNGILQRYRPKLQDCVFFKLKTTASITGSRYISLKHDVQKFIGKEYEIGKIVLEIEIELFTITKYQFPEDAEATKTAFDQGLYNDVFRLDLLVGNELVATTRMEHPLFNIEDDYKMSFAGGSVGAELLPGGYKSGINNKVSLNWKKKIVVENNDGFVNVRIYQPKTSLPQIAYAEYYISKIEVKQIQESQRFFNQSRNINYSKKEKPSVEFWESKSDLTYKNFKVDYSPLKMWNVGIGSNGQTNMQLTNRLETAEFITYDTTPADAEWLQKNYDTAVISKNGVEYLMKDVFGFLNSLEGNYIKPVDSNVSVIYFNKKTLRNLFYLWQPFSDFIIKVYKYDPVYIFPLPGNEPNRDQSLKWVRYGNTTVTGYGTAYARSMLDVKADPYVKIDGTVKKIIGPLDVIRFKWIMPRNFWISNLSLDFSNGSSKVFLCESTYKNTSNGTP